MIAASGQFQGAGGNPGFHERSSGRPELGRSQGGAKWATPCRWTSDGGTSSSERLGVRATPLSESDHYRPGQGHGPKAGSANASLLIECLCESIPDWISHAEKHESTRGFGSHHFRFGLRVAQKLRWFAPLPSRRGMTYHHEGPAGHTHPLGPGSGSGRGVNQGSLWTRTLPSWLLPLRRDPGPATRQGTVASACRRN